MAVHLIKLCVGIESPEQLMPPGRKKRGRTGPPVVHTKNTPKRAAELLDGGSIYWVIKGVVLCRQAIVKVNSIGEGPNSRCIMELSDQVVLTEPAPRRAFQGWRYLQEKDAPRDLKGVDAGELPTDLARELLTLGAW